MCAAARRIECDVGCEMQYETWTDAVREVLDECVAAGNFSDPRQRKEHKKQCKEVFRTNVRATKLAGKTCLNCCELAGHEPLCQIPPVLCGDDVVGEGEACDGGDDAACPGRCGVSCGCGFSPAPAFMTTTPGTL
jgi:hypothetical protein